MSITLVFDCTSANLDATVHAVGANQVLAGYDTQLGNSGIKWTDQQFAVHPNAVHYDQDPNDSDYLSDLLDVEAGAGVAGKAATWYQRALHNFQVGTRPGQRHPGIYVSASGVTPLVNALISGGVKSGPGLHIANWNLSEAQAVADVAAAAGPFPIIGVQFKNNGPFDTSVMSSSWLALVSGKPVPPAPAPTPVNLLGIVAYIQEGFKASTADFVSKRVTSTDNGKTWH